MKKTININLNKTAFIIDEDAYKKLETYLKTIEGHFKDSDGRKEIMEDIEARIAELLQDRLNHERQVITTLDIETIIEIMGRPEEYVDEEATNETSEQKSQENSGQHTHAKFKDRFHRKIYRDTDNRFIGGVCSGLEHYFGIDKVWIRLLFVLLFFTVGFSLLLYIILWVIIPEARTTAEKLEMRGQPADFSNIGKAVEEEMDAVKDKFNEFIKKNNTRDRFHQTTKSVAEGLSSVFSVLFGLIFCLMGLGLIIPFFMSIFGDTVFLSINENGIHSIDKSMSVMLLDKQYGNYFWIGFSAMFFSLMAFFLAVGSKLLFKFKASIGWVVGLSVMVFMGSIAMFAIPLIDAGKQLKVDKEFKEEVTIPITNNQQLNINSFSVDDVSGQMIIEENSFFVCREDSTTKVGYPTLSIQHIDSDSSMKLIIVKHARGASRREALERAKSIEYHYSIQENNILLDPYYSFQDVWRVQELEVIIQVPENMQINKNEYTDLFLDETIAKHISVDF